MGRKLEEGVEIVDLEYQGYGVAKPGGKVLFVEESLPGEIVDVRITKNKRSHAFGRPVNYHKRSPKRIEPFCEHFDLCGGCKWQYLSYSDQLSYKQYFVTEIMERLAGISDPPVNPILGCESDRRYRNKLEYSFSNARWLTAEEVSEGADVADRRAVGFHVQGRFDRVVDVETCHLQPEPSNEIRNALRDFAKEQGLDFFDHHSNTGLLRTLIIRTTTYGETMVVVVFGRDEPPLRERVLRFLAERFPKLGGIHYINNERQNDSVVGLPAHRYSGSAYIRERCGELELRIGPQSFYQTNSLQAERLYQVVAEWGTFTERDTVMDLYCGIGSIGLFLAPLVHRVIGIESVQDAVEDARNNAAANGIGNAEFMQGEVERVLANEVPEQYGRPDIVVLDPPRAGVHPQVLDAIAELRPRQILYVSCKPSTQARDLERLASRYEVLRMQPVDMFPQTYHIENVADLRLREERGPA
jgi:23S rRNA (uracil1939-C5)-methyltransferase